MKSTILLLLTALVLAGSAAQAGVINLVTNGSFEQGVLGIATFQGWQTTLPDANTFVDSDGKTGTLYGDASDGLWSAFFGTPAAAGGASISQSLATTPNQLYSLSFDLANDNGGLTPVNSFVVSLGGAPVLTFTNIVDQVYIGEQYSFVASGNSTALEFSGSNDQSYFDLDNVAVTPAPEPSSFPLAGVGAILLCAAARNRTKRLSGTRHRSRGKY